MRIIDRTFEQIEEMVKIQGRDGNWNYDEYMHGMYNGMELILAMIEERSPNYRNAPERFIRERGCANPPAKGEK
jgi:hypothetical protein